MKVACFIVSPVFKVLVCKIQTEKKLGVTNKSLLNPQNLKKRLLPKTVSDLGLGPSGKIAKCTALSATLLK